MLVVVALLLVNLGTLCYLFLNNRPGGGRPQHPPAPDKMIMERLKLTDGQILAFEGLRDEHHSGIVRFNERSKELYQDYFALLKTDLPNIAAADSMEQLLAQVQEQKDSITFDHFLRLRQLCTEEQKPRFDSLVDELGDILVGQPPKRRD
ncbi:hypothetical protein BH09BAC1_BH09BAC1_15600 [soil metagenome]